MIKVKHARTADCVVAGFRWHKNGAGHLVGSLLLGLYDAKGALHHVGVTSSFTMGCARSCARSWSRSARNALRRSSLARVGGGRGAIDPHAGRPEPLERGQGPVLGAAAHRARVRGEVRSPAGRSLPPRRHLPALAARQAARGLPLRSARGHRRRRSWPRSSSRGGSHDPGHGRERDGRERGGEGAGGHGGEGAGGLPDPGPEHPQGRGVGRPRLRRPRRRWPPLSWAWRRCSCSRAWSPPRRGGGRGEARGREARSSSCPSSGRRTKALPSRAGTARWRSTSRVRAGLDLPPAGGVHAELLQLHGRDHPQAVVALHLRRQRRGRAHRRPRTSAPRPRWCSPARVTRARPTTSPGPRRSPLPRPRRSCPGRRAARSGTCPSPPSSTSRPRWPWGCRRPTWTRWWTSTALSAGELAESRRR